MPGRITKQERESTRVTVEPNATYYMKVYRSSSSAISKKPYFIGIGAIPEARDITPGTTVGSKLSSNVPYEIWRFQTGANNIGKVHIQMSVPSDADYDMQVYKDKLSDQALQVSEKPTGQPEAIDVDVKASTTYYIKCYHATNTSFSDSNYQLTVGLLPTIIDNFEPNDEDEKAAPITPGSTVDSYISAISDVDMWKFQTGAMNIGPMSVNMHVPNGMNGDYVDYDFQVYKWDTTNDVNLVKEATTRSQDEAAVFNAEPNTTYLVKIYLAKDSKISPSTYQLSVSALPIDYEPNENDKDSKEVVLGRRPNRTLWLQGTMTSGYTIRAAASRCRLA